MLHVSTNSLALMLLIAVVSSANGSASERRERIRTMKMSTAIGNQQLQYLVRYPETQETQKKVPLLLFLHGAGERGSDLSLAERHGPSTVISKLPALRNSIIITPQCPAEHWWRSDTLYALLTEFLEHHQHLVDTKRLYVTGLSMGGYATWKLASDYPNLFAAAVPICGGGDPSTLKVKHSIIGAESFDYTRPSQIIDTAIWAFHGVDDHVVPIAESRRLVEIVKRAGNPNVRLTEYQGVKHDSWTQTYSSEKLYGWLFKQQKAN